MGGKLFQLAGMVRFPEVEAIGKSVDTIHVWASVAETFEFTTIPEAWGTLVEALRKYGVPEVFFIHSLIAG